MKKIFLISASFMIVIGLKSQNMSSLYEYVINDYYKLYLENSYISENDTMHYVSSFANCENNLYGYSVSTDNPKIQFGMPLVNGAHQVASVFLLSHPEVIENMILISVSAYILQYNIVSDSIIYTGTTDYMFVFRKGKYILKERTSGGI